MVKRGIKNGHQKGHVSKRDWTTCSTSVSKYKFNGAHNWEDSMINIRSLIIEFSQYDKPYELKNNKENNYSVNLDLLIVLYKLRV